MTDSKNKLQNAKDKIVGKTKEAVGNLTNDEELELKGKIQSSKSDLKEKAGDIKNNIAGKINDIIDKKKSKDEEK